MKHQLKTQSVIGFTLISLSISFGCGGSSQAILPTGELTEEQKAAVKAEDDRVNDEESQGSFGKKKKK